MHPIRLDHDTHTYWKPGPSQEIRVPGFSEICEAMGVTKPNPHYTEAGRVRGTAVHKWASYIAVNGMPKNHPDERIAGRVEKFRMFLDLSGFQAQGTEVSLYHPGLGYACTEDLYGYIGPWTAVIDLKTGGKLRVAELQTAAQKMALAENGFRAQRRFGLYLKDGNYRLHEHLDRENEIHWSIIVEAYHAMSPDQREAFALMDECPMGVSRLVSNAFGARSFYI